MLAPPDRADPRAIAGSGPDAAAFGCERSGSGARRATDLLDSVEGEPTDQARWLVAAQDSGAGRATDPLDPLAGAERAGQTSGANRADHGYVLRP